MPKQTDTALIRRPALPTPFSGGSAGFLRIGDDYYTLEVWVDRKFECEWNWPVTGYRLVNLNTQGVYDLEKMQDGSLSCDCPDSLYRQYRICKHRRTVEAMIDQGLIPA